MTHEDVTEHDLLVFHIVGMQLSFIRPRPGEYELVDDFCQYSAGVRFLCQTLFVRLEEAGRPYRLHVVADGLAFIENTTPVTWRHRLKRWFNDHLR